VRLDGDRLTELGFTSRGCSISQATASMMTESVKGHRLDEADTMVAAFKGMMLEGRSLEAFPEMEELEALQGVKKYPVRIKCALLPWNTLKEALDTYRASRSA